MTPTGPKPPVSESAIHGKETGAIWTEMMSRMIQCLLYTEVGDKLHQRLKSFITKEAKLAYADGINVLSIYTMRFHPEEIRFGLDKTNLNTMPQIFLARCDEDKCWFQVDWTPMRHRSPGKEELPHLSMNLQNSVCNMDALIIVRKLSAILKVDFSKIHQEATGLRIDQNFIVLIGDPSIDVSARVLAPSPSPSPFPSPSPPSSPSPTPSPS